MTTDWQGLLAISRLQQLSLITRCLRIRHWAAETAQHSTPLGITHFATSVPTIPVFAVLLIRHVEGMVTAHTTR